MVSDPYKTLGLTHDASPSQIKTAYRKLALQYHPDRLTMTGASEQEKKEASDKFAAISAAYNLLSDEQQKREYDHIYKYGGFDDDDDDDDRGNAAAYYTARTTATSASPSNNGYTGMPRPESGLGSQPAFGHMNNRGRGSRGRVGGIGFAATDPLSFLFRGGGGGGGGGQGGSSSFAGIHIPSRHDYYSVRSGNGTVGGRSAGFRFTLSSAQCTVTPTGARKFVSRSTHFINGKKFTRIETTIVHPDGTREVQVEERDNVNGNVSRGVHTTREGNADNPLSNGAAEGAEPNAIGARRTDGNSSSHHQSPWYTKLWNVINDKLTMCHGACGPILVQ